MEELNLASHSPADVAVLLERVQSLFEESDKDGDKTLDFPEFQDLMQKFLPDANRDQLLDMFHEFDVDNSGSVQYSEILAGAFFRDFITKGANMVDSICQDDNLRLETKLQHAQQLNVQLQDHIDRIAQPAIQRNTQMEREIEDLKEKLTASESENLLVQEEVSSLRERNRCLEEDLQTLHESHKDVERQLDESHRQTDEEYDAVSGLQTRLQVEQEKVADLRGKLKLLFQENETTQKESQKFRAANERLSSKNERLQDRFVHMTEKYDSQNAELQSWMKRALELEQDLEDHQIFYHDDEADDRGRANTFGALTNMSSLSTLQIGGPSMANLNVGFGGNDTLFHELGLSREPTFSQLKETTLNAVGKMRSASQGSRPRVNTGRRASTTLSQVAQLSNILNNHATKMESELADLGGVVDNRVEQLQATFETKLETLSRAMRETIAELRDDVVRRPPIETDTEKSSLRLSHTPAPSNADEIFGSEVDVLQLAEDEFAGAQDDVLTKLPDQERPTTRLSELHMRRISKDLNSLKQMLEDRDNGGTTGETYAADQGLREGVDKLALRVEELGQQMDSIRTNGMTQMKELQRHLVTAAVVSGAPERANTFSVSSRQSEEPEWAHELAEELESLKVGIHDHIRDTIREAMKEANRHSTARDMPAGNVCGFG